jgi:hypothetical protein
MVPIGKLTTWVALSCTLGVANNSSLASCPRYEVVTDLVNPIEGTTMVATELNNAGYVAGSLSVTVGPTKFPFVWFGDPDEPPIVIPRMGAAIGQAFDVNEDKLVVGVLQGGTFEDPMGFVYDGKTGHMRLIGTPGARTDLVAISESGIIGGYQTENGFRQSTVWIDGSPTKLFMEGAVPSTTLRDVNSEGTAIVKSTLGFVWQAVTGSISQIPDIGEPILNVPEAINEQGDVVGTSVILPSPVTIAHPYLMTRTEFIDIGSLADYRIAQGVDVNQARQVVGTLTGSETRNSTAYVWEFGEMYDLRDTTRQPADDAQISTAIGLNDTGLLLVERVSGSIGRVTSVLRRIAPVTGDATCDQVVGFDDVLSVLSSWGAGCGRCTPDIDKNGSVDTDDLKTVLENWGLTD